MQCARPNAGQWAGQSTAGPIATGPIATGQFDRTRDFPPHVTEPRASGAECGLPRQGLGHSRADGRRRLPRRTGVEGPRAGVERLTMAAFFLELFSEEIPARMQPRAAEDLARLIAEALAGLSPANIRTWYGPRRIALAADVERAGGGGQRDRARTACQRAGAGVARLPPQARRHQGPGAARKATTGFWKSRPMPSPRRR